MKRPHVVILGSTHGNEPAGGVAAKELIDSGLFEECNCKVTVVPFVNKCGVLACWRNNPLGDYDVNRNYISGASLLNKTVMKIISSADWVIDLHEGWGFHKENPQSVGSGVYPGESVAAKKVAVAIVDGINREMGLKDKYEFVTFGLPVVRGSLRDYCGHRRINYILVETSGIGDIQDLHIRVSQHKYIIQKVLQLVGKN